MKQLKEGDIVYSKKTKKKLGEVTFNNSYSCKVQKIDGKLKSYRTSSVTNTAPKTLPAPKKEYGVWTCKSWNRGVEELNDFIVVNKHSELYVDDLHIEPVKDAKKHTKQTSMDGIKNILKLHGKTITDSFEIVNIKVAKQTPVEEIKPPRFKIGQRVLYTGIIMQGNGTIHAISKDSYEVKLDSGIIIGSVPEQLLSTITQTEDNDHAEQQLQSNADQYAKSIIGHPMKTGKDIPSEEINPLNTQVGGQHYASMKIQPVEFAFHNNLSFLQGSVIKYITRYKQKNGKQDLEKAKHFIDLLIQLEYSK